MKTKLLGMVFLAGSCLFARPHVVVGVGFGYAPAPVLVYNAPPAPYTAYVPPAPGPGYTWVAGYWYPVGARRTWHAGYWARPGFGGARWVAPRYYGNRFYSGYWRR